MKLKKRMNIFIISMAAASGIIYGVKGGCDPLAKEFLNPKYSMPIVKSREGFVEDVSYAFQKAASPFENLADAINRMEFRVGGEFGIKGKNEGYDAAEQLKRINEDYNKRMNKTMEDYNKSLEECLEIIKGKKK